MNKLIEELLELRSAKVDPNKTYNYTTGLDDSFALVKKHMEPQLIVTTDGSPEAVKFVADAIGSDMCACGHDRETHNQLGCMAEGDKDESIFCLCTKFTPEQQEKGKEEK